MSDDIKIIDISNEQFNNLVDTVTEKVLLRIPKVIGNLMAQHATANKLKKDFYKAHPEFVDHKEIVASVIEKNEGKDLTKDIALILNESVPEIREKIKVKQQVDLYNVKDVKDLDKTILPETELKTIDEVDIDDADNGVI